MAFLTESSYRQLIERIEVKDVERIDKQFFIKNIFDHEYLFYFFNQFDLKRLFKEKIVLSGDKFFVLVYKEVPKRVDNLNYILEIKGKVKYHRDNTCVALNRGFKNFFMPESIVRLESENPEKHKKVVEEIRHWFEINNFTVDRYISGEINDKVLTSRFNEFFPCKFEIEPIFISQSERNQYNWYVEKRTTGNVGTETGFDYSDFLKTITDLINKRDNLCDGRALQDLSRYDFLINRTDEEIEKYILDRIRSGKLNITVNFIKNYGLNKLKEFWKNHYQLKNDALNTLTEYFKWTYNYKEKSFDEVFLKDFNLESCSLCYSILEA